MQVSRFGGRFLSILNQGSHNYSMKMFRVVYSALIDAYLIGNGFSSEISPGPAKTLKNGDI